MKLLIEDLTQFGLTRQEATIYLTLVTDGELTGYEAAKLTGISRSNTYTALAGLVEKGAAFLLEGNVAKYTAADFTEFSNNFLRSLTEQQALIAGRMPARKKESDGYITIRGKKHIIDKVITMISGVKHRVYLSVPDEVLKKTEPYLKQLITDGKKVVILAGQPYSLPGAIIYQTGKADVQLRLIADSINVLTGRIDDAEEPACLYSSNRNLVDVFKDMLQNEITLIKMKEKKM